jgi:hypothetical protein
VPSRVWVAVALLAAVTPAMSAAALADDKDERPQEKNPGLKSRVFEVKHRDPEDLSYAVRGLSSAVKGTNIAPSREFKTIVVRDFPENISAIEEALKRLDVPAPPKPDIELRMRVLFAAPSGPGQYPADLEGVVKQLQATLNYKAYFQIASVLQRVKDGAGSGGKGVAQVAPPISSEASATQYSYGMEHVSLVAPPSGGPPTIQVRKFHFSVGNKTLGEADITTGVTLREGEKVVVGTAILKDRAMVLVLSARVLK